MANIIIGTAGHIDHGKSTLIKALTGINTDTTEEEIERGLSINLGFAYFDLPNGKRVGIIDVPGHERFIKNMLAGAQGINMILLVIDANEGVMPQTIEHANFLTLLGVEDFIIVLTKSDLVEDEMLDLLEEDIREKFKGTVIEKAPLIRVDSLSKRGFLELIAKIEEISENVQQKNIASDPRLNVDRVFSVKGFGTVVTGTLSEGVMKVNDDLMVYTSMVPTKIRNIQVHEKNVEMASAGQRTALNLQNLKVTDIKRGDVLSKEGVFNPSFMVDIKATVLKEFTRPLKLWDRLRVYIGTREVMARCVPLGCETISPGEEGYLQLRLEDSIVCKPGDRLILRTYSPMVTLGGGIVLDPATIKHKRFDEEVIKRLEAKETSDSSDLISDLINNGEKNFLTINEILAGLKIDKKEAEEKIEELLKNGSLLEFSSSYTSMERILEIKDEAIRLISIYHKANPLKAGMPKEELKSKMKYVLLGKFFEGVMNKISSLGFIDLGINSASLPSFEPKYTREQEKIKKDIIDKLKADGYSPRSLKELTKDKGYREVMDSLMDGEVIRIEADIAMLRSDFKKAYEKIVEIIEKNGSITLAILRDELNTSRKYAVAILDFLDKNGITLRKEDERVLTGKRLSL